MISAARRRANVKYYQKHREDICAKERERYRKRYGGLKRRKRDL